MTRRAIPLILLFCTVVSLADAAPFARVAVGIRACSVTIEADNARGSGTLLRATDGRVLVLTAAHVTHERKAIRCIQYKVGEGGRLKGMFADAELVAESTPDSKEDLALLNLGRNTFPCTWAKLGKGTEDDLPVIHCGSMCGDYHHSIARGHIVTAGRSWEGVTWDQLDVTHRGGSSGGGVFSRDGKLVGVLCQGVVGGDRVAFSAPVARVRQWLEKVGVKVE